MTLTPQHIQLLTELEKGQRTPQPPLPIGYDELYQAGYIRIESLTRDHLSVLIVEITPAGRRALHAAEIPPPPP
jgi:hypothetical protein